MKINQILFIFYIQLNLSFDGLIKREIVYDVLLIDYLWINDL